MLQNLYTNDVYFSTLYMKTKKYFFLLFRGKVGEVDTLGRYHSYWEPAPDINKVTILCLAAG